ncbi:MAG: hypothetical protein QOD64_2210 [Verrucomicrobiota bacterium]|jgi:hypothetical protein
MEVIEADFVDGLRRPDPSRWDLARLSKLATDEEALAEEGLREWEMALCDEDRS